MYVGTGVQAPPPPPSGDENTLKKKKKNAKQRRKKVYRAVQTVLIYTNFILCTLTYGNVTNVCVCVHVRFVRRNFYRCRLRFHSVRIDRGGYAKYAPHPPEIRGIGKRV